MSSDAGLLALAGYAQRSGDIDRIALALTPRLTPGAAALRTPTHSTAQLLTQRVMQLIGGYPDGNDSDLLRHDPVLQMLVGRAAPGSPEAVLASQPTMSRLDNKASLRDPVRAFDGLVDNFIASYQDRPPQGLVPDLDPAACIVYGQGHHRDPAAGGAAAAGKMAAPAVDLPGGWPPFEARSARLAGAS